MIGRPVLDPRTGVPGTGVSATPVTFATRFTARETLVPMVRNLT